MSSPSTLNLRPRRAAAVVAALALLLAGLVVAPGATGAADGRVFEMTTPEPERGYWLAGESVGFRVECLDGEDYERVWHDEIGSGGWAGGSEWGQGIDPWAAPGNYEWVLECTDADGNVVDSETFTVEIGSPASLVATVGTVEGECATTTEIEVDEGTEVHWCYRLLPHPDIEDDLFYDWGWDEIEIEIVDTLNGTLGTFMGDGDASLPVDGLSLLDVGLFSSSIATADLSNTGTWTVTFRSIDDDDIESFSMMPVSDTAQVRVIDSETPDTTEPETPSTSTPTEPETPSTPAPPAAPLPGAPAYVG